MTEGERGSATVIGVALVAMLCAVALIGAALAGLLVGQRRAAAAADLAALAGASALQEGQEGCPEAASVAAKNGATLTECHLAGANLTVEVTKTVSSVFGRNVSLRSSARAGPGEGSS
jgi:secretion/DNA translocation related TadE-like protein